jgi:DNA polymerase elongation subunit (family B)
MLDVGGKAFGQLTLPQPHVHVMHKIEQRTPGAGPRIGDRVRYVFVDNKDTVSDLQIARAEDPVWAQENGLRPDACYYFEHSVKPPLEAVLALFATKGCAELRPENPCRLPNCDGRARLITSSSSAAKASSSCRLRHA